MISDLSEIKSKNVLLKNGLNVHYLETGYEENKLKPCIIMLHGFPELSYSFRKIMLYIGKHGFHIIAPDQRGYGSTIGWSKDLLNLNKFNMLTLANDIYQLKKSLSIEKSPIILGHDFGSTVASFCSLLYPNNFSKLIIMSTPFTGPPNSSYFDYDKSNSIYSINQKLNNLHPPKKHYQHYFSSNTANDDIINCKQGLHNFFRQYFYFKSADWKKNNPHLLKSWDTNELIKVPNYYIMDFNKSMPQTVEYILPNNFKYKDSNWITEEDISVYCSHFKETGFQGALNWYKAMYNQEQIDIISSLKLPENITIPSLFIAGKKDWGIYQKPHDFNIMKEKTLLNLIDASILDGAGHWVQQEQPKKVAEIILNFLNKT